MTDHVIANKSQIRARMRAALAAMTPAQRHSASVAACTRLMSLELFEHATTVMLYMPLETEVDVTAAAIMCFRRGQTVCVPKVEWDRREMYPVEITSLDDRVMDCDEHGVRVPRDGAPILPDIIDAIVVPGLAFDSHGRRLGRGAGYYDRFLARLRPNVPKIGLAFDVQIVHDLPAAPHDVTMDILVTDRRLTMTRPARSET